MADILLAWSIALASGDFTVSQGGLSCSQSGADDLRTAVLVSLFTDRRVPADYKFASSDTDPRGWWADTYTGDLIGSRLWTLNRAKSTDNSVLQLAKTYCIEALQWLLDDDIAASVTVQTSWINASALGLLVTIVKPSGQTFGFAYTWAGF